MPGPGPTPSSSTGILPVPTPSTSSDASGLIGGPILGPIQGPILGIESSCDETAAAIVAPGDVVLSSVVASQYELHAEYGGVVPEIASRAHVERITPVVREALKQAGLHKSDLAGIAVGCRPGLIGSLLVGVSAAKALAWSLNLPLIGVDHVHAHLYSGLLQSHTASPSKHAPDESSSRGLSPSPSISSPALGLVVSGGHTSIYRINSWSQLTRLGATIDDAMGEAYDKAAVMLGLPHPGGPNLDALANSPNADERRFDFPISRLSKSSLDFSFSGLKTSVLYATRGVPGHDGVFPRTLASLTPEDKRDIAAGFQRAASAAIILKLERALDHLAEHNTRCTTLFTGGGVTANSRLRRELIALGQRRNLTILLPAMSYCVDNAAMIAGLGARLLAEGLRSPLSLPATPTTAC